MGYAATTCLVYGIEIDDSEAQRISDHIKGVFEQGVADGTIAEDSVDDDYDDLDDLGGQLAGAVGLGYLVMRAEGMHSAANSCEWRDANDPAGGYVFGYDIGANGYGANDNIAKLLRAAVPKGIEKAWKDIEPILKAVKIKRKPKMHIVTQTH